MRRILLSALVCLLACPALVLAANGLSARDVASIRRVHHEYEEAWLKGDADRVRALFAEDFVLLPHHGDPPRIGRKGMNEFWFPPDAPPARIIKLTLALEDIGGDGKIAYVWGTDEVAWTTTQAGKEITVSNKGTFLNVMKKLPNGEWKISHHMWDDPVPQQQ